MRLWVRSVLPAETEWVAARAHVGLYEYRKVRTERRQHRRS